MAKGDGSITKLGPNRYRVQISYGKDPITGKYQRATKVVNGTKADARKVRDQMRKEREGGLILDGSKLTFEEFAEKHIEIIETSGNVGREYIDHQRSRLAYMCRYIGDLKLKEITPQVIESTLVAVKRDRTAELGRLSNSTLRNYYETLKLAFDRALAYDFIMRNPCDKVKPPTLEKVDRKSLTAEEAALLLRLVNQREEEGYARIEGVEEARERLGRTEWPRERIQFISLVSFAIGIRIGLATGMREGEVLGLLWDSVDLEGGTLVVRRSLNRKEGLKEPKTAAGIRVVSIDADTVRHLVKWKREQAETLSRIGINQDDLTPVVCNGFGELYDAGMFWRQFKQFREEAGFSDLKFHELRHTQASLLLGNGVDVKTVQKRLGHARASVTLDTYAHALPENDKQAANLIGDLCTVKRGRIIKVKTA